MLAIFSKIYKKLHMNFFWNRSFASLRSKLNFWIILEYVSPRFTDYLAKGGSSNWFYSQLGKHQITSQMHICLLRTELERIQLGLEVRMVPSSPTPQFILGTCFCLSLGCVWLCWEGKAEHDPLLPSKLRTLTSQSDSPPLWGEQIRDRGLGRRHILWNSPRGVRVGWGSPFWVEV